MSVAEARTLPVGVWFVRQTRRFDAVATQSTVGDPWCIRCGRWSS
jgi:hypothetical protein